MPGAQQSTKVTTSASPRVPLGVAPHEIASVGALAEVGLAIDSAQELSLSELPLAVPDRSMSEVLVVDVRAPREFAEDHLPGARNVPLFDDRERAVVGTLYRMHGAPGAREWGAQRVGARLEAYVQELEAALELPVPDGDRRPRVVVCARGGQRSGAVTAALRALGHPVRRLRGGVRAYREWVRTELDQVRLVGPFVLNGLTGVGKTRVLRAIQKSHPDRVIDLEGLAGHRSSILGDIGLQPVSQRRFEAALAQDLRQLAGPWTLCEWEARRLGNREIPLALYRELHAAPQIELVASLERRIEILRDEYLGCGGVAEVQRRLGALAAYPALGPEGVAELRAWLSEGRIDDTVRVLLERHYDPRYRHGHAGLAFVQQFTLRGSQEGHFRETAAEVMDWLDSRT